MRSQHNAACCYLLQVCSHVDDRSAELIAQDLADINRARTLAQQFNVHQKVGENALSDTFEIRVAPTVGCEIMQTTFTALLSAGDHGVLTTLPDSPLLLEKFLFDGTEEYQEIAHTFFHYCFFTSEGEEMVADLQGLLTDDTLTLVDPVLLRAGSSLLPAQKSAAAMSASQLNELFRLLYPRVTGAARVFDPYRRASAKKQMCGIVCA